MGSNLFKSLILFLPVLIIGCATKPVPREASTYLLSTDKPVNWFLDEIAEELKKNKYEISTLDPSLGILSTEPRQFVIFRGDERTYGEQTFTLRQEGGSVKLRLSYECEYPEGKEPCTTDDREAMEKIAKIEKVMLSLINRRLYKKPGEDRDLSREI